MTKLEYLTGEGFQVSIVRDGAEALERQRVSSVYIKARFACRTRLAVEIRLPLRRD